MKFPCTVQLLNRKSVAHGQSGQGKACKGVIHLRRTPTDGNLFICVSTNKSLVAHQFSVWRIATIRKNFIHEGKLTMEIWEPEMNLMIRDADEAHLKALLQEIQAHPGMKGEITGGNNTKTEQRPSTSSHSMEQNGNKQPGPGASSSQTSLKGNSSESFGSPPVNKKPKLTKFVETLAVPAPGKELKVKLQKTEEKDIRKVMRTSLSSVDLKVTKRENYPIKQGFPSKLRYLLVNGINLGKIDSRILALKNLQTIDLSQNSILSIEKLQDLNAQLTKLILDDNRIEKISEDFFKSSPMTSLIFLSLKGNQLLTLPRSITKLMNLEGLVVTGNRLQVLPYNFHEMRKLRRLAVNDNCITFLPFSIKLMTLLRLDISGNPIVTTSNPKDVKKVCIEPFTTLFERAASVLMTHNYKNRQDPSKTIKLDHKELPAIVTDMLESCKYCFKCDSLAARYVIVNTLLIRRDTAHEVISQPGAELLASQKIVCASCS